MLENEIKEQLQSIFEKIENTVELIYDECTHDNQPELLEMLQDIASTSQKILVRSSQQKSPSPSFKIFSQNKFTGISFRGIPGGHEFTSLILAILNADNKGKLPDAGMVARIQALKGPVRITTYVSLTCENCPEVVQALNQMATLHGDFHHETVDGAYAQSEIDQLGIQGVPSIVVNGKMVHSGRIHFLDLLKKLEEIFGTSGLSQKITKDLGNYDVAILGGGPAGVSAAIYSARKGFKTALVAERMGGQVQDTKGIENMISLVYTEGPQLAENLYKHLSSYPIDIIDRRRIEKLKADKTVLFESGETLSATSIVVATGAQWRKLGVPGEQEYVGRGVAYCPHCDGPFYKGKRIVVVGGGNSGVEAAIDLAAIAGHVTVFEYNSQLKADRVLVNKLKSLTNVTIQLNAKTEKLIGDGQKITSVEFLDRASEKIQTMDVDGVFIQIGLLPNSQFAKETLDLTPFGEIQVDGKGRTNVPGIYAAGDVTTTPYKQIIIAMGEGAKAALALFEDRMLS